MREKIVVEMWPNLCVHFQSKGKVAVGLEK